MILLAFQSCVEVPEVVITPNSVVGNLDEGLAQLRWALFADAPVDLLLIKLMNN